MDWQWYGYLARGYVTLLIGLWKAGKSTLLAHILRATAQGGDIGGLIRPANCLVVTEEGAGLWARRRDEMAISDNVSFIVRPFKGRPTRAQWLTLVDNIARRVRAGEFDLIAIDTWQTFSPCSDENDSAGTMEALLPLHRIADAGAAILLLHHPKKGDANEGQASRGSGALPGFVDIIIELRRFDPERASDTRRTLKALSRFDESPQELVLELGEDGYRLVGTKSDAHHVDRVAVIEEIFGDADGPMTAEQVHSEWPSDSSIPKPSVKTVKRDLTRGHKLGVWQKEGSGKRGDPLKYSFISGQLDPLEGSNRKGGAA